MNDNIQNRIETARTEKKCLLCSDEEWMELEQTFCWRCKRILKGLMAAKLVDERWLCWNYKYFARMDLPEGNLNYREWGRVREKQDNAI